MWNGLLWETYGMAWNLYRDPATQMEERDLLSKALKLWVATRLTTTSTVIVGEETLGMPRDIMPRSSPQHGKIPLPPVMGAQIDMILISNVQTMLRREMLDKLQRIIQQNKQSTWLTTYLVTFVLLHNIALITKHDHNYAKKHGMQVRDWRSAPRTSD